MSETITVTVPHRLTRLDARSRIDSGFAKVQEQIGGKGMQVEQEWHGDEMHFKAGAMGQSITGKLVVGDENVVINVDLPWLLTKIAGTVKEKLAKGTQVLLEKK